MELSTAISLIQKGVHPATSQRWADLGAGKGLFTKALSEIVGAGSIVFAVDKDDVPDPGFINPEKITINRVKADFTKGLGEVTDLDGILMANSLHFVRDKMPLLRKLSAHMKSNGRFVIVEYDTDRSNTWVPYPISFKNLERLVSNETGTIAKIGEAGSRYQSGGMYAVSITL